MELKGGYILQGVRDFLYQNRNSFLDDLLSTLSSFQLESNKTLEPIVKDSIFAVLHNIITRGLPTIPSVFVEDVF